MSFQKDCHTKADLDLCIFHDIFRRADKNDDGAISWAEFVCYFSDGIMTDDGMRALFTEIDTHHTNNIDTQELCSYFSSHLGAHAPVFKAAATLCNAVSLSMKSLAETHPAGSSAAQFIDRFLLREICAHLEAQHRVLRNALDSLESQGRARASAGTGETPELAAAAAAANCQGVVLPYTRLMSAPSSMQVQDSMPQSQADSAGRLQQEVQKLQRLVDRMEANTSFFTGRSEEAVMEEEEPVILVVRRRVTVQDEQLSRLRAALKKYAAELEGRVPQCLFLSVRVYRETGGLVIYEFWESLGSWRKFLPSPVSKELRKCIVDCSEAPESTETLLLPSDWWKQLEH
ncbi:hypothetical protein BOX15_Mlig007952g1 [Macrostomum lignano]|uniref:EF-hand domain-containing protein n=1 Tax=Macrostomum lignano TaxID=282301 RepID=A0A267DVS5_9PLAT|nr:hypothetical protein BOX15_Mlig007952g3 [Macrostomum lignano]PAA59128.1 hypothetical protein BOX15_Mlig007952g2 [Macrostomum lignano]PAA93806.1 hypothetical protein BOX15_Mlig007952g1 [Macrostomum lignano]